MSIRLEGIHFLVTYRCTFACDHCFVWGSPDAEGMLTLNQLTSVIDQAADCGIETVYFEGGEAGALVRGAPAVPRARGLAVLASYDPTTRPVIREILAGGPWDLAQAFDHTPLRELSADECHLCCEVRSALRPRFPEILTPAQCYGGATSTEEDAHAV
jgi:hypothetical protein